MNCEHLIFMRDNLDLSQREMAEKLNVSKSTYARWETCENIIPLKHLINFCNLTNNTLDYAIGLTDKKEALNNKIKINKYLIGINIKNLRLKQNLSQKEFAKSINTTQSVISAYENGHTLIQTSFLYDICNRYKISSDKIIY